MNRQTIVATLLFLLLAAPVPSVAQDYERAPPGYGDPGPDEGRDQGYGGGQGGGQADDAGAVSVRVGRLEGRIREMTGQIEELQNANRRLVEQLQKFQQDVDSRLSAAPVARSKRSETIAPSAGVAVGDNSAAVSTTGGATPKVAGKKGRNDAFDPDAASPNDPGKPKPLGSVASGQPDDDGSAPMDLSGGRLRGSGQNADTLAPTLRLPSTTPKTAGGTTSAAGTVVASVNPASPRAEFDTALGYYKGKQYEDAEKGFTAFIQKNPKSRLAADATYYLGESYAQRGRSREAAEQYLKISTDYSSSTRAPDAMLHLGMSLKALGAKEQACATFSEVTRKYPNAPSYVKTGAERESKRAQC